MQKQSSQIVRFINFQWIYYEFSHNFAISPHSCGLRIVLLSKLGHIKGFFLLPYNAILIQ